MARRSLSERHLERASAVVQASARPIPSESGLALDTPLLQSLRWEGALHGAHNAKTHGGFSGT